MEGLFEEEEDDFPGFYMVREKLLMQHVCLCLVVSAA